MALPEAGLSSGRRAPWRLPAGPNHSFQMTEHWIAAVPACSSDSPCSVATRCGPAVLSCTAPAIPPTTADPRQVTLPRMSRYPDFANADLLERIPLTARTVLDVGCNGGALGMGY